LCSTYWTILQAQPQSTKDESQVKNIADGNQPNFTQTMSTNKQKEIAGYQNYSRPRQTKKQVLGFTLKVLGLSQDGPITDKAPQNVCPSTLMIPPFYPPLVSLFTTVCAKSLHMTQSWTKLPSRMLISLTLLMIPPVYPSLACAKSLDNAQSQQ